MSARRGADLLGLAAAMVILRSIAALGLVILCVGEGCGSVTADPSPSEDSSSPDGPCRPFSTFEDCCEAHPFDSGTSRRCYWFPEQRGLFGYCSEAQPSCVKTAWEDPDWDHDDRNFRACTDQQRCLLIRFQGRGGHWWGSCVELTVGEYGVCVDECPTGTQPVTLFDGQPGCETIRERE
jgi:hypothetical protein